MRGVSAEVHAMADGGSASGMGSGGMTSKLQAAEIAERAGIALAIINGTDVTPLARALSGEGRGTLFLPRTVRGQTARARKAWLGGRLRLKGALVVDAGAAKALASGSSLLAAGVTADTLTKVKAGELVNFVAQQVGGKGGGKPDMAMAGGTQPAGVEKALASVHAWVVERL